MARNPRPLRVRDVQAYRVCDGVTELLIYLMVLFSPWAFGTTQPWAIWTMNISGYVLGLLLAIKLAIRHFKDYRPPRWGETTWKQSGGSSRREEALISANKADEKLEPPHVGCYTGSAPSGPNWLTASNLTSSLAALTVAILGYCLIGALNARATYHPETLSSEYHEHIIKWLPNSLDSNRTWLAFWNYFALACSFWAVRDWLLGKTLGEQRADKAQSARRKAQGAGGRNQKCEGTLDRSINPSIHRGPSSIPNPAAPTPEPATFSLQLTTSAPPTNPPFPARLRRLLWLLAINGGLLGLEAITQRLEGSGKLLFLVKPRVNPGAESQFGPYAYRSNAAQYFNLLWPIVLGFWWMLQRSGGSRRHGQHLLLVCAAIMAACPIISISRGGALITVGILVLAALLLVSPYFLLTSRRQEDDKTRGSTLAVVALFFIGALALGLSLGWKTLSPRMAHLSEGFAGREEMYAAARPMTRDYSVFGVGPGAFETVFQLYRISTETYWPAQLHNDWLETLITFGWAGSALVLLALVTLALRWFGHGGIHGGRRFVILMWLALAGCLVHARFDFPFQIYSILFLFLVLCAVLFNLSRRP